MSDQHDRDAPRYRAPNQPDRHGTEAFERNTVPDKPTEMMPVDPTRIEGGRVLRGSILAPPTAPRHDEFEMHPVAPEPPEPEPVREERPSSYAQSSSSAAWETPAERPRTGLRIPPMAAAAANPGAGGIAPVPIGMWGGPGSGKTTYLGGLITAVEQQHHHSGQDWTMSAADEQSMDFLIKTRRTMVSDQEFPVANLNRGTLSWTVRGQIPFAARRWARKPPAAEQIAFRLDVVDRPGGDYVDVGNQSTAEAIDHLANSQGLIYLLDPLNRNPEHDSFTYFHGTLARLAVAVDRRGRFEGAKLPHHLAVCITKFDSIALFRLACDLGIVGSHPLSGLPWVANEDSERFFDAVCATVGGTAEYIRDAIRSYFIADRVRYYVVTSVGYHQGAEGRRVDFNDTTNSTMADSKQRIRSRIQPVNVLEPIIDLHRMIRRKGAR
jgi:hypothetical protein